MNLQVSFNTLVVRFQGLGFEVLLGFVELFSWYAFLVQEALYL